MARAVECHSGYTYAERPAAIEWEGRRLIVAEVEATWRLPEGRRFRLRTEEGSLFELTYDETSDAWHIRLL